MCEILCVCIVKCTPGHICIPHCVHCVATVCDLSKCAWTTYVFVWVHKAGGIGTPNHVRAVTSRAEIGLVSPVIRRRGERGKKRKLEERKRLFHHQYFPLYLHLHNNFISNSRHWIQNRRAIPLWSRLKLIEYLYADCGTLNSLSFRIAPPLRTSLSPISSFRIAFVRIWHYFYTSKSTVFPLVAVERACRETEWIWAAFGQVLLPSPRNGTQK